MKVYIKTKAMQGIAAMASRFIVRSTPLADYLAIHVSVTLNSIQLFAVTPSRSYVFATAVVSKCDEPFSFCIDGKLFKDAIDSVRGDDMAISLLDGKTCLIGFIDGSLKLPTMTTTLDTAVQEPSLKIMDVPLSDHFAKALQVAKAAERQDIGTCGMAIVDGKVCVFGSDDATSRSATRFSLCELEVEGAVDFPVFYFRNDHMNRALSCCPGVSVSVFLANDRVMLFSSLEGISCKTGFVNAPSGKFPIKKFSEMAQTNFASVSSADLFAACRQLSVVKLPESAASTIDFGADKLNLEMVNSAGESKATIKSSGPELPSINVDIESMVQLSRCFPGAGDMSIGPSWHAGLSHEFEPSLLVMKKEKATVLLAGLVTVE